MKLWKKIRQATATLTTLQNDETGLFIPNRQVSWVVAAVILFGFLTFITGYFWGQRKAIERFVHKIEEESFADRISYSLYTMNDRDATEFEDADQDGTVEAASATENSLDEETEKEPLQQKSNVVKTQLANNDLKVKEKKEEHSVAVDEKIFVAPLAGFGTLHAASSFARRVRKLDPNVQVKTRISKTPKGKTVAWYQAVTGEFDNREDLERVIGTIKQKEHIKEIRIIEKRKVVRT